MGLGKALIRRFIQRMEEQLQHLQNSMQVSMEGIQKQFGDQTQ
ncbi:hypothetical protein NC652_021935 [Populus alba x Populus x berolinensis]|nr:hypothetical protein NC652_021935 [Populus alba x Populus x berolinensis]